MQGGIRVKAVDAHGMQGLEKGFHNGSAKAFALLCFIDVDPAQVGNIPLGQEMNLTPADFPAVVGGGKLPAITGTFLPPAEYAFLYIYYFIFLLNFCCIFFFTICMN